MKVGIRSSFSFIEPMKALPVENPPEGDWLYDKGTVKSVHAGLRDGGG